MTLSPYPGTPSQETVATVAGIWQVAGVSVIPILANQTKRPAVRWAPYQASSPTLDEVHEWWGNGKPYGLALICGGVSGGLELLELEGRATDGQRLNEILNRCDELGVGYVWDLLTGVDGYSEQSPSGGLHLLYRIVDHEVPGNTKLASNVEGECLAETRGTGGYCIVAPTPGICHPTGEPWLLLQGKYGNLPLLTWEQRNTLHQAMRLALDERPTNLLSPTPTYLPTPVPTSPPMSDRHPADNPPPLHPQSNLITPGDDFEARTNWEDILQPHGWQVEHRGPGGETHWTRPGKERRDGASATTGRASDRDRLYVFSTSTVFQSEVPYTKFGAFALLNFGGDHSAAASALVSQGYGSRPLPVLLDQFHLTAPIEEESYSLDDVGNGMRLARAVAGRFRWVVEEKVWYWWDGAHYRPDIDGGIVREWVRVTEAMLLEANTNGDDALRKFAKGCRNMARITAAINMAKSSGLSYSSTEWNPYRHLLNVHNGVLNLRTGELVAHHPKFLMTNMFNSSYDPQADCPNFKEFMSKVLPDEGLRNYVQRALGYSLLGDSDQRSLFLIYGPSGTGKSTLMEAMRELFGDYGTTAQSGTFRAPKNDKAPTNDLHELRGKRFVATSETAETSAFDEDLLKRLSGRDRVRSRALYQESVEWVPECTIWVATNNAPRFNSDDNAIWRRTKLIPFNTVFSDSGEIFDYARKVLALEHAGILNWLLAGLWEFLRDGALGEPDLIQALALEQRQESDSVARFLDDEMADGLLVVEQDQRIRATEIFSRYSEWAKRSGERGLGNRRFANRVRSLYPDVNREKVDGHIVWLGIGRTPGTGITGAI